MSPHFSFILYLPWLSSWELLWPPHQRSLWVLLGLRHCIQGTYNSFRFRWFSWQSLWQWVPFWGLWFTFGIFILNRSCCQQIFSLLRGQFLKFLGTTEMISQNVLFFWRWQMKLDQWQRKQWWRHHNWGRRGVWVGYTLPGLLYPLIMNWAYQRPKLTICPSTLRVVARLSKTVG